MGEAVGFPEVEWTVLSQCGESRVRGRQWLHLPDGSSRVTRTQQAPLMPYEGARTRSTDLAESTTLPHSLVLLAKMILPSADGISRIEVVRCVSVSVQAPGKRRGRFLEGAAWWNCMNSSAPAGQRALKLSTSRA